MAKPAQAAPAPTSAWALLLLAALAGTRRHPFAPLPGLTPPLGGEAAATEKALLLTATNLTLVARAGRRPLPGPAAGVPPESAEPWPAISPAAAKLLLRGLREPLLLESSWVVMAQLYRQQRRIPRRWLGSMLHASNERTTQVLIQLPALFGRLGPWLAAAHPRPDIRTADLATEWQPGRPARRQQSALGHWRNLGTLPARQADLVLHDLQHAASARTQAELLNALCVEHCPLPASWQPTLEALAGQPSNPGCESAVGLLARLPGNDLAERAWRLAAPYLRLEPGPGSPRLLVELPTAWDAAWVRAGLRRNSSQDKCTHWLTELLAVIEPGRWAAHWHLTAAEAVALAHAVGPAATPVLEGWLRAAARHRDAAFAHALLGTLPLTFFPDLQAAAWAVLPVADQLAWLHQAFPTLPTLPVRLSAGWNDSPGWLRVLYRVAGVAPESDHWLLTQLRLYATNAPAASRQSVIQVVDALSRYMGGIDPRLQPLLEAAGAAADVDPVCAEYFRKLASVLAFRRACAAALAEPAGGPTSR